MATVFDRLEEEDDRDRRPAAAFQRPKFNPHAAIWNDALSALRGERKRDILQDGREIVALIPPSFTAMRICPVFVFDDHGLSEIRRAPIADPTKSVTNTDRFSFADYVADIANPGRASVEIRRQLSTGFGDYGRRLGYAIEAFLESDEGRVGMMRASSRPIEQGEPDFSCDLKF